MSSAHGLEVERKYSVGDNDELPDFTLINGVHRVGAAVDQELEAVYFDTATLALAARGITLRRRAGGSDPGWHLKLPVAAGERWETREPLNRDPEADADPVLETETETETKTETETETKKYPSTDPEVVPARLKDLVSVHTRGQNLVPIAELKTRRTVIHLIATDGTILAEFSDDRVASRTLFEPVERSAWREWEIELVDGGRKLLKSADAVVASHGHQQADLPSKLARALGGRYPAETPPPPPPRRNGPASAVLVAYLFEQVEALKAQDQAFREGAPDAVHQLRVAARRMRSALATFGELIEKGAAKPLREELHWLAATVGTARDLEVRKEQLVSLLDAEAPDREVASARDWLEEQLDAEHATALASGLSALSSDRYFRLLDALDDFLASPPLTSQAQKAAERTVGRLVNAERKRLKGAVKKFAGLTTEQSANRALHWK
ncbi:CHAD domain-containing protein [Leucobacter sp. Z1108]|uniref:CYTH and CHAD domain-containing protein n=1 Tax=Leucobacter sp. Z1108 TaxID=3439066 RepID=UPI003F2A6F2C